MGVADTQDQAQLRLQRKLLDPLNRLYRYRIADALASFLKTTPISPNMITVLHTGVGVFAAWMVFNEHYVVAACLYEGRTILDCLDGVLARIKNQSTVMGRPLDTIGDGVAFNALMVAGALRMIRDFNTYNPVLITLGVFFFAFIAAHCGTVYHLMKRKLGSILRKQLDTVEIEWREHYEKAKVTHPTFISRFGFWVDSVTIKFVSKEWYRKLQRRRDLVDWKEKALSEASLMNELAHITRVREFKQAVGAAAYVSDDNIFAVISLCFIVQGLFPNQIFPHVHPVLVAFGAGLIYGVISLLLGLHYLHSFLHGVYRE